MRHRLLTWLSALLVALALAACGDDGDDGGSDSLPNQSAAAGAGGDDLVTGEAPPDRRKTREQSIKEAKATFELLIDTLNKRDPGACELVTLRYLESIFSERGRDARESCVAKVRTDRGSWEILRYTADDFRGRRVALGLVLQVGTRRRRINVELVRDRVGNWRLDARRR